MKNPRHALVATATALVLGVSACSGTTPDEPVTPFPETNESTETSSASAVEIPDTEVGRATQLLLDVVNGKAELTVEEVPEWFAESFVEAVGSAEAVVVAFTQAITLGPFEVLSYDESPLGATTALSTADENYTMTVAVDRDGLMTTAAIQVAPEIPDPATSWDELTDRAHAMESTTGVTVIDVTDGVVGDPQFTAGDAMELMPSGSMFKLFVLLAVVDAVEAGDLTWDTTLTLTEAARSLPSGVLQDEPDGTEVSVQDAAEGMISISDNTATDLLMQAVGVDAVEEMIATYGPDGASVSIPVLTTRALFEIGWGEGDLAEVWADADPAEREQMRDEVAQAPLTTTVADAVVPVWQHDVDWFFSVADLARAHLALQEVAQTEAGAPVAEIFDVNPGLDLDAWDTVAFKGGSSVGVMAGSWYLATDDAAYVVVVQSATTDVMQATEQATVYFLAADAAKLLAQEG